MLARFYGGGPQAWSGVSCGDGLPFLMALPRLRAQESIRSADVQTLGNKHLENEARQEMLEQLMKLAGVEQQLEEAAPDVRVPKSPSQLASMGITVEA